MTISATVPIPRLSESEQLYLKILNTIYNHSSKLSKFDILLGVFDLPNGYYPPTGTVSKSEILRIKETFELLSRLGHLNEHPSGTLAITESGKRYMTELHSRLLARISKGLGPG